jgi:hypothetical protein
VLKDADTNAPIAGATVFLGGHTSVFDVHSTTTNASGQYTLTGLYPGHTYHVIAARSGYDLSDNAVAILPGSNTANLTSRHDWANGAAVAATGPDYSDFGCGPDAAVDGSLDTGWSTDSDGPGFPFQIVVTLPNRVNLTASGGLQLAPGADCGDPVGNALAHYQLHTSQNGTTWNLVSDATFAPSDNGNLHPLAVPTAARSNVRYLKLVMLSNQSGVDPWIDMRELKAYGTAAP